MEDAETDGGTRRWALSFGAGGSRCLFLPANELLPQKHPTSKGYSSGNFCRIMAPITGIISPETPILEAILHFG